jgi:hypothetical protein
VLPCPQVLGDPTFRALGLASCLISIWFVAGPFPDHHANTQLLLRHEWKHCADVVLVGDSSLVIGVHPETIEAELASPYRVVSFGILDASLSERPYLDAAEDVLDPSSPHRMIVVSITSDNVSLIAASKHSWKHQTDDLTARARPPSLTLDWRDELDLRLRPRGLCAVLWNVCSWMTEKQLGYNGRFTIYKAWHDETFRIPDVQADYEDDEPGYSHKDLEVLLQRIVEMKQRGVDVVGYVERDHPLFAKITAAHGYDPAQIERELRATDVEVIDYPTDALSTFDGVHLDAPAQDKLSHLLGRTLARRLPPHALPLGPSCPWPLQTHPNTTLE